MEKKIKKYINGRDFVKVYIANKQGKEITYFSGMIFNQSDDFILMCDFNDFNYDGFVVLSKSDISEIVYTKSECFFDLILEQEGIKEKLFKKIETLQFELGTYQQMFEILGQQNLPVIIEQLYKDDAKFQIGSIQKVKKKKVVINYFNARGVYDRKPVSSKFKDITFFRVDNPYANLFYKYAE